MKKFIIPFCSICLVLIIGCASLSPERVVSGKHFKVYMGHYDSSIPLENHSYLINLADNYDSYIFNLNGVNVKGVSIARSGSTVNSIAANEILVLPSGQHTLTIDYFDALNGITGRLEISFNPEPGQYYFLRGGRRSNELQYSIAVLSGSDLVRVPGSSNLARAEMIAADSIVAGINTVVNDAVRRLR